MLNDFLHAGAPCMQLVPVLFIHLCPSDDQPLPPRIHVYQLASFTSASMPSCFPDPLPVHAPRLSSWTPINSNKTADMSPGPTNRRAQCDQQGRTETNECGRCSIDQQMARWQSDCCCFRPLSTIPLLTYWQGIPPLPVCSGCSSITVSPCTCILFTGELFSHHTGADVTKSPCHRL